MKLNNGLNKNNFFFQKIHQISSNDSIHLKSASLLSGLSFLRTR
jgi:hypothetical protein